MKEVIRSVTKIYAVIAKKVGENQWVCELRTPAKNAAFRTIRVAESGVTFPEPELAIVAAFALIGQDTQLCPADRMAVYIDHEKPDKRMDRGTRIMCAECKRKIYPKKDEDTKAWGNRY